MARALCIAAAAALIAFSTGCGLTSHGPIVSGGTSHRPIVSGGTPAQRALLKQILGRMGQTHVTAVNIRRAQGGWRTHRAHNSVVLAFHGPRRSLRVGWDAEVVGAVFRVRSAVRGLPPV